MLRLHRGIRHTVYGMLYTGIPAIEINEISVAVYIEVYAHNVYYTEYTRIPINVHVCFLVQVCIVSKSASLLRV